MILNSMQNTAVYNIILSIIYERGKQQDNSKYSFYSFIIPNRNNWRYNLLTKKLVNIMEIIKHIV